jgi:hypothetical protein
MERYTYRNPQSFLESFSESSYSKEILLLSDIVFAIAPAILAIFSVKISIQVSPLQDRGDPAPPNRDIVGSRLPDTGP